jgi:plasmid segregation protein ParM
MAATISDTILPIGVDIGYANTKIVSPRHKFMFPSIVGTPEKSQFKLMGAADMVINLDGRGYNVGESVIRQSRFSVRQESREWISTKDYRVLFYAALASVAHAGETQAHIVTGLPIAFYELDKDALKSIFEGVHVVEREEQPRIVVNVMKCNVIPQASGTLLNEALDDTGAVSNPQLATGSAGIIDIGGKTTNIMHANKLGDIRKETESINLGGWDLVSAMGQPIERLCPGGSFKEHEIADAIRLKAIMYKGETIDLSGIIAEIATPMAENIVAAANALWDTAKIQSILLTGGGANLLGDVIIDLIDHKNVRIVEDPVFSNVYGYLKLATKSVRI